MSDRETAERLLGQTFTTPALLVGARPFKFIQELGLLDVFEIVEGDPSRLGCVTCIRVYDYCRSAPDENYYRITPDGELIGRFGRKRKPEIWLSTKIAPSGWEISYLAENYSDVLSKWLEEHPDG